MTFDEANELLQTAWEGGYFSEQQQEANSQIRGPTSLYQDALRHWAARAEELLQLPKLEIYQDRDIQLSWYKAPKLTEYARRFFL